jgi:hypothetical protein
MFTFKINECPLCHNVLKMRQLSPDNDGSRVTMFRCPTEIEYLDRNGPRFATHYEVQVEKNLQVQRMFLLPYQITNCTDHDTSLIIKIFPDELENGGAKWRKIGEFPQLRADTAENMKKRIDRMIPFL